MNFASCLARKIHAVDGIVRQQSPLDSMGERSVEYRDVVSYRRRAETPPQLVADVALDGLGRETRKRYVAQRRREVNADRVAVTGLGRGRHGCCHIISQPAFEKLANPDLRGGDRTARNDSSHKVREGTFRLPASLEAIPFPAFFACLGVSP